MAEKKFNFSQKFEKLQEITDSFEQGDVELDEGIKQFEEGLKIAGELKKHLEQAELKIKVIKEKFSDKE